jgi:hypothetical protein
MPAPNPRTWVNGEFVQDSTLNGINGIRDALRFLLDPPRCRVRSVVAQSIPTSAYTAIAFATEDYDNEATASYLSGTGMHDPATNNTRITIQTAGTYLLTGQIGWAGNATGRRGSRWDVNGVVLAGGQSIWAQGSANGLAYPAPVMLVPLNVGDFVELKGFQESGAALSTVATSESQSRADVRWIGF